MSKKTKESKIDEENEWTKFMTLSPFDEWLQDRFAITDDLEDWETMENQEGEE